MPSGTISALCRHCRVGADRDEAVSGVATTDLEPDDSWASTTRQHDIADPAELPARLGDHHVVADVGRSLDAAGHVVRSISRVGDGCRPTRP